MIAGSLVVLVGATALSADGSRIVKAVTLGIRHSKNSEEYTPELRNNFMTSPWPRIAFKERKAGVDLTV